ncbi:MAG: hypothetical protein EOR68_32150, partial [Mesorhizobium sp.]
MANLYLIFIESLFANRPVARTGGAAVRAARRRRRQVQCQGTGRIFFGITINQPTMAAPVEHPILGRGSVFHADKEAMSPGYLSTFLISAALTATCLVGMASGVSAQVVIPTNRNALVQQNQLQQLQNQLQRQQ